MKVNQALFLDRDGILMEDSGYVGKGDEVVVLEDSVATLKKAQALGFLLIVVTNQAGVAKGLFTLADAHAVNQRLAGELKNRGVVLDDVFVCPFHPEGSVAAYRADSNDRKPKSGMVLKAVAKYNLDLSRSIMVGDKDSDVIECAELKTILLQGKYPIKKTGHLGSWRDVEAFLQENS